MADNTKLADAAEKFLERDFVQCFTQMRHYDQQNLDLLKFTFTAYVALIGVSFGLYQFSTKEGVNLIPVATAILCVGFLFGLFMFALIVRNRVYFVLVARYINEHRRHFLKAKPLGFENRSRMYASYDRPHFFNLRSSHSFHMYLVSTLNGILASGIAMFHFNLMTAAIVFVLALISQLAPAIAYLRTREKHSADTSVFGSDGRSDIAVR